MEELEIRKTSLLPDTLDDLKDFILIGKERIKVYQAKVRAIDKLGLAKSVKDAALEDGQYAAEAVLYAEAKLGDLLKSSHRGTFKKGGEKSLPANINKKQSHYAQSLANNQDLIEEVIREAKKQERLPVERDVLRKIKDRKRRIKISEIKQLSSLLPKYKYQVIYCDPPWKYDVDLTVLSTRSPENNYPVMDLKELISFGKKVKKISHNDCVLFMWITAPKLNWMNFVLEAWNFEYKTNLIWDKVKPNMGHYSSVRHEILIIAGKGNCSPLCDGKTIQSIDSVQSIEKSNRHSEKPEEFRKIINILYPDLKKIELFARKKETMKNWTFWGNEIDV